MRACRAAGTLTAIDGIVERTGIEPAAAALQVQLAPLAHASPETGAVPTRIELAWRGRQPRILTRGLRNQNNSRVCEGNRTLTARFTDSHADHYTTHTMWITIVSREGVEPSSVAYRATALATVLTERAVASQGIEPCACSVWNCHHPQVSCSPGWSVGSKPGNRTLHVRRMRPITPPGELLAMLAGRRGIEPR
jgi:hypothetical protein